MINLTKKLTCDFKLPEKNANFVCVVVHNYTFVINLIVYVSERVKNIVLVGLMQLNTSFWNWL